MRLDFEGLPNTRDLGGIRTADGYIIRSGKLIRSGHLCEAKGDDLTRLAGLVDTVVDFRTDKERAEKPDPPIPGVENIHLPIMEQLTAGVSHERETDEALFARLCRDTPGAKDYMERTYTALVSDFALRQYARFIRLLMEPREKAVLWHCTAGKDRAGFAAVLVLKLLGVDDETILRDYLATNDYQRENVNQLIAYFQRQMGLPTEAEEAVRIMFSADETYLQAAYREAEERFGSFEGMIEVGMGIDAEDIARIRAIYLE